MFTWLKKRVRVPHDLKFRIRGDEATGYIVEYCLHWDSRRNDQEWTTSRNYEADSSLWPTLESAKAEAKRRYADWMQYYETKEKEALEQAQEKAKKEALARELRSLPVVDELP